MHGRAGDRARAGRPTGAAPCPPLTRAARAQTRARSPPACPWRLTACGARAEPPAPGAGAQPPHARDAAASPLVRALPQYERGFRDHLAEAAAAAGAGRQRLAAAVRLANEMEVQVRRGAAPPRPSPCPPDPIGHEQAELVCKHGCVVVMSQAAPWVRCWFRTLSGTIRMHKGAAGGPRTRCSQPALAAHGQPARRRDGCAPGAPRPGARDRGGARERGDALRVHLRAGGRVPAQARARPRPPAPAPPTPPSSHHTRCLKTPLCSRLRLPPASSGCCIESRLGSCCMRRRPGRKAATACFQRRHFWGHMKSHAFAPCASGRAPYRPARAAGAHRARTLRRERATM